MATLATRINDLAGAIRDKINLMVPRLLPSGGTTGQILTKSSNSDYAAGWVNSPNAATITYVIDGGGAAITTGVKGDLEIPFPCTIVGWTLVADQQGSIVIDVWKDVYGNYPPTVADTITASNKPTLSSSMKARDQAATGWTKSINESDILRFNVDSVSTVQRVTLSLKVLKT